MRTNLIRMLDGIGLAGALHIDSSSQLFDSHFHMVANASAIGWPVFVNGANYTGSRPPLLRHPTLRSLTVAYLGTQVAMA